MRSISILLMVVGPALGIASEGVAYWPLRRFFFDQTGIDVSAFGLGPDSAIVAIIGLALFAVGLGMSYGPRNPN
jgi:hypothetical protein